MDSSVAGYRVTTVQLVKDFSSPVPGLRALASYKPETP